MFFFFLVGSGGGGVRGVTGAWSVPLVGAEVKAAPAINIQSYIALTLQEDCHHIIPSTFIAIIFNSTNECTQMSVTIIVEITNKLLRHISTHEVSSSGSSLVLAKITYECTEMCKL